MEFILLIVIIGIFIYGVENSFVYFPRKRIMSNYDEKKNKIVMTKDEFFKIRHSGKGNNGLFFPNGYEKPPVYKRNGEYLEVELVD